VRGEKEMRVFKDDRRVGYFLAILLGAGMFLGGCAATINYSYDQVADFSTGKSYNWAPGLLIKEPLLEKNVRYFADQSLQAKGFTLSSDKPDLMISMNYELEYFDPYKVRSLSLYVYRTQDKELIWQGTARGDIKGDTASPDLAGTVKKILSNFPRKR
jgi:hypothetical protein